MDEQNVAVQSNDQEAEYTAKEIKKDLLRLYASPTYQKLNAYYQRENFFNILGKSRNENAHSNFLAWLLDSRSSHGLGTYPMTRFLQMLDFVCMKDFNWQAKEDINNRIPSFTTVAFSNEYCLTCSAVSREKPLKIQGRNSPRKLDFFIECKIEKDNFAEEVYYIVIENKIYSPEGEKQTTDYYNGITREFGEDAPVVFVFLTPLSSEDLENRTEQQCMCKKFIQINYQYMLDYVIQACVKQNLPDDARFFLDNYIRCLGDPSYYEEKGKKWGGRVMAIGEEERELLEMFGKDNDKLISAYVDMFLDDKTKKAFNEAKNNAQYRYRFTGEREIYSQRQMPLQIIKRYIEKHPTTTISNLQKLLETVKQPSGGLIGDIRCKGSKAEEAYSLSLKNPKKDPAEKRKADRFFYDLAEHDIAVSSDVNHDQFESLLDFIRKLPKEDFPWEIEKA